MSNTYAMALFLFVIISTSSTLCVANGDPEIFMVVDNQSTIMHDSGMAMSKANPIQIGKFLLEDGKVLTLSRKSSPSRNCITPEQPCGVFDWCCEGLRCDAFLDGRCQLKPVCVPLGLGGECALFDPCCYPYRCNKTTMGITCVV